jgi:hypothetical protein
MVFRVGEKLEKQRIFLYTGPKISGRNITYLFKHKARKLKIIEETKTKYKIERHVDFKSS